MKTTKIYLAAAILALAALASSCLSEENWDMPQDGQIPISLAGDITQLLVTRASDNGFTAGDQVGIWAVNYEEDTPGTLMLKDNQATNVRFTYDGTSWTSDYDIYYKDKNTKVDIYGVYPYSSAISSIEEWPFEVQEDQSTVSAHGVMGGYEASDFLWAKREAVMPSPSTVQLLFQHRMSCVVVTLQEGTGFAAGEFAGLSQSVLINNVKRNATINLAAGEVTATGAVPARSTVPTAYENGFRAIVVPQTVSSACSLFSITLGGVAYTYSEGAAFTYIAGKQHNFTVTVDKKPDGGYAVTVQTSISAWTNDNSSHDFTAKEYVVVNVETPGTLGETLTSAGKNPDAIKNLKVLGTVNADDFYYMRDNMAVLQGINMQETILEGKRIPNGAFDGKEMLNSFIFPDGNHNNQINYVTGFSGTSLSGTLIIPEGVTNISGFAGTKVNAVLLPDTLECIEDQCFYGCSSMSGPITFPNNLVKIGDGAFVGCINLSGRLLLPSSLQDLGGAFGGCARLTGELAIPASIKTIKGGTFNGCSGFSKLTLHEGITTIEHDAFGDCRFKGELLLPSTLRKIGNGAFGLNMFSGQLTLPRDLVILGEAAFEGCSRLSGVIEFPESVTLIPRSVFAYCSNIEGVILHSGIFQIDDYAFHNCFQLNSIVSYASTPPIIFDDTFSGVAKDNFTVEVPEYSVNDYALAVGWNEFVRISAYRDFSVSRRQYRALSKGESIDLIIRAESGSSWCIEEQPEWVTVTPASGVGKTEITVLVNPLVAGSGNRSGEVVFLLNDKNYRSTLSVEQYDYVYYDGAVITVQTHTLGNGIPLVFMGDCYDAADIASGDYLADTQEGIGYFFDVEPYKTYKDYFDVYVVFGKSEDSGIGSVNTIRDSKFGTQYSFSGGGKLENTSNEAFSYAKKADPNMDISRGLVVMIINSSDYDGYTSLWKDGSAIAFCPKSSDPYPYDFRGLVQHEAGGHGFGKLADEYIYYNAFIPEDVKNAIVANQDLGWFINLSVTSDRNQTFWTHLLNHPSYSNTVDIYEGGYTYARGIYRSEPNSCMNNNIPYYSAISRQAIVERIMDYAGMPFDIEAFYANDIAALGTRTMVEHSPYWMPSLSNSTNSKHHEPIIMGDHPIIKQ